MHKELKGWIEWLGMEEPELQALHGDASSRSYYRLENHDGGIVMDASLINPFINATMNVLETMAFTKCKANKPYVKKDDRAQGDVTGVIGLTGLANGTVAVTFDEGSILKIVSNMFGEEIKELGNDVSDAVGELTNMISGNARRELEEQGKVFHAAVPSVISGKSHVIKHYSDGPKIAIPFDTENGTFTIEVCIEKQ